MAENAYKKNNFNIIGMIVTILVIIIAVFLFWKYLQQADANPQTDDAVVGATLNNIGAIVPGRIAAIYVKENDRVKKGDLLFELEPEPLQLLVDQAKANVALAQAAMDAQKRALEAETVNAKIADEQVVRASNNLELTEATLKRLQALGPKGYVTKQQIDDARTLRDDAMVSLTQAQKQAAAAHAVIGTLDSSQAAVQAAEAALALAEYNLANAKVYAPHDGLVVGVLNGSGQIIAPGQSVFTLIDTSSWYASAAFTEIDLTNITVGTCATVRILADQSKIINGRVQGIGWGVSSDQMINVPRNLPYLPKSLNWVQIAQRFPVRIMLDNPPENLTRVGASAVVTVHNGKEC